jgi:hypothetical protein
MASLRPLAKRFKRLAPLLLAPAAVVLGQDQAKAVLNVNIFESGSNLKMTVTGSIAPGNAGSSAAQPSGCFGSGSLSGEFNPADPSTLCSGIDDPQSAFADITGPTGWGGTGYLFPASSVTGKSFQMYPSSYNTGTSYDPNFEQYKSTYALDPSYILGQPFFSSATFNGASLASQGFTQTGLIGTWTIDGTTESINVYVAPPAPGPLPLLGAGAAFGWTRRLRKRASSASITSPKA